MKNTPFQYLDAKAKVSFYTSTDVPKLHNDMFRTKPLLYVCCDRFSLILRLTGFLASQVPVHNDVLNMNEEKP